jgi:hypothetical protein
MRELKQIQGTIIAGILRTDNRVFDPFRDEIHIATRLPSTSLPNTVQTLERNHESTINLNLPMHGRDKVFVKGETTRRIQWRA